MQSTTVITKSEANILHKTLKRIAQAAIIDSKFVLPLSN
jgi:hypothetical protein